jgi:hypothetical protein
MYVEVATGKEFAYGICAISEADNGCTFVDSLVLNQRIGIAILMVVNMIMKQNVVAFCCFDNGATE